MSNSNNQNTIIKINTTTEISNLLLKAATLQNLDISTFILQIALEKTDSILSSHYNNSQSLTLSLEGQLALVDLLNRQQPPSEAMINLRNKKRLEERK